MKNYWIRDGIEENIFDVIRLVDVLVLLITAHIAYFLRLNSFVLPGNYLGFILTDTVFFLIVGHLSGLYKLRCLHGLFKQVSLLLLANILPVIFCLSITFLLKSSADFSRLWLAYWLFLSFSFLCVERYAFSIWFRQKLKQRRFVRKAILVGDTAKTKKLMGLINDSKQTKIEALAIYLPNDDGHDSERFGLPVIRDINSLIELSYKEKVDDVIIACEMESEEGMNQMLSDLRALPCHVHYCLPTVLFGRESPDRLWEAPLVSIYRRPLGNRQVYMKRLSDIVISFLLLLCFSPALLISALLLKMNKAESVLFKQSRNGFMGEFFNIYKFRTMTVTDSGEGEVKQAQKQDPRITKTGAILRKTSMDELPQLFNVLRGEMSIVGPRPHAVSHNAYYNDLVDSYAARNRVKPGITGWAQIHGCRGETDTLDKMKKRVAYDLYYIENWSLFMDLKIILLTPFALFHKNAYWAPITDLAPVKKSDA